MKSTYILPLLLASFLGTTAQPYIGFHFIGSAPINTFCDSNYRTGLGVNFEFMSNNVLRNVSGNKGIGLRFGTNFDFQGSGSKSRSVILNTPNNDKGTERFSNSHVGFHLITRTSFMEQSRFTPYVDAFIGLRGFYSNQAISSDKAIEGYETQSNKQILNAGTRRIGASLGAFYRLNSSISLDTRVTYSAGTEAQWLNLEGMKKANGFDSYATHYSKTTTDLFIYHVGIKINLNRQKRDNNYSNPTPNYSAPNQPVTPNTRQNNTRPRRSQTVTPSVPAPAPKPKKPLEVQPAPRKEEPSKPKPAH